MVVICCLFPSARKTRWRAPLRVAAVGLVERGRDGDLGGGDAAPGSRGAGDGDRRGGAGAAAAAAAGHVRPRLRAGGAARGRSPAPRGSGTAASRPGRTGAWASVFGPVRVTRMAYRNRREPNLYPADARWVLPDDPYSLGMRALAAYHLADGGYGQAQDVIGARTGVTDRPRPAGRDRRGPRRLDR